MPEARHVSLCAGDEVSMPHHKNPRVTGKDTGVVVPDLDMQRLTGSCFSDVQQV